MAYRCISDAQLPVLLYDYDRTGSILQKEFTPFQWKDTGVERNVKVGGVANSRDSVDFRSGGPQLAEP